MTGLFPALSRFCQAPVLPWGGVTYRGFFVNGFDDKFLVIERNVSDFTPGESYLGSQSVEIKTKNIRKEQDEKDIEHWCLAFPSTNFSLKMADSLTAQPVSSHATRSVDSTENAQCSNEHIIPCFFTVTFAKTWTL